MSSQPVILLLSNRPEDLRFTQCISLTLGIPLIVCADFERAQEQLSQWLNPIVFTDVSTPELLNGFHDEFLPLIAPRAEVPLGMASADHVHFIVDERLPQIDLFARSRAYGHLIVRKPHDAEEGAILYSRLVEGLLPAEWQTRRRLDLLTRDPQKQRVIRIDHSDQKSAALDQVQEFLSTQSGLQSRVATSVVSAVDELLLNAIYDAAEAATGSIWPRNVPMELKGRRAVELRMGSDGNYTAVTVIDQFGSIDRTKLVSHILKACNQDSITLDPHREGPGAGIGLATIFRSGGCLLFNTEPGVRTEVTVIFKHAQSYREFRNQARSLTIRCAS